MYVVFDFCSIYTFFYVQTHTHMYIYIYVNYGIFPTIYIYIFRYIVYRLCLCLSQYTTSYTAPRCLAVTEPLNGEVSAVGVTMAFLSRMGWDMSDMSWIDMDIIGVYIYIYIDMDNPNFWPS